MNEKTEAIVLHSIKHSDTSTILHLLTEKFGHLAFAVSGIRGKRSRIKASMLMPLTLLEIDFNNNNKFDLQRISDAKLLPNCCTRSERFRSTRRATPSQYS